jgi:hypothetical protein
LPTGIRFSDDRRVYLVKHSIVIPTPPRLRVAAALFFPRLGIGEEGATLAGTVEMLRIFDEFRVVQESEPSQAPLPFGLFETIDRNTGSL